MSLKQRKREEKKKKKEKKTGHLKDKREKTFVGIQTLIVPTPVRSTLAPFCINITPIRSMRESFLYKNQMTRCYVYVNKRESLSLVLIHTFLQKATQRSLFKRGIAQKRRNFVQFAGRIFNRGTFLFNVVLVSFQLERKVYGE